MYAQGSLQNAALRILYFEKKHKNHRKHLEKIFVLP